MSTHRLKSFVIIALAAAALALASTAWAGGRHHGHGYPRVSWGVSVGFGGPYWRGYAPPPGYFYPAYGPPVAGGIGISYVGGRHGGYGVSLALPLYFGPRYAPPPVPVAVPVAVRQAQPAPAWQLPPGCLQTREYQTEIVVGGERVPAYGTACLQQDGSWKMLSGPIAAN